MTTRRVALMSLALAGLRGCSTSDHLPEYSGAATAGTPGGGTVKTGEGEGAIVALEPFADKARCETYLTLNVPAAGIAIFHLRVENRSPDTTWLLPPGSLMGDSPDTRRTLAGHSPWITLRLSGAPPTFAGLLNITFIHPASTPSADSR